MNLPWPFEPGGRQPADLDALLRAAGALAPALQPAPATVVQALVLLARERLVGRRFTLRAGEVETDMLVREIDARPDVFELPLGRFGDVRVLAADCTVLERPVRRLSATFRDVRLRPGPPLELVAAPVELAVTVCSEVVAELVRDRRPGVSLEVGDDAMVRLRWSRRPGWCCLEVTPELAGHELVLRPRRAMLGGRAIRFVQRLRPIRLRVPELSPGVVLTGVEPGAGEVTLHLRADSRRVRSSLPQLTRLLRRLAAGATSFAVRRPE